VRERQVPMVFTRGQELEAEDEALLPLLEDLYRDNTSEAIVMTPMLVDKRVAGVLIVEYDDPEDASARSSGQSEIAQQAAPVLEQIVEWRYRPLRRTSDALANVRRRPLTAMTKLVIAAAIVAGIIYGLFFVPVPMELYGNARLEPAHMAQITAPQGGRVETVNVKGGEMVKANQLLATLDDTDLKLDLARVEQATAAERVQLDVSRKAGDAPSVQASQLNIEQLKIRKAMIERQLDRTQVRSLIEGVVLTERPERMKDMTIAQGDQLLNIADLSHFDLVIELEEEDLAVVDRTLRDGGEIEVSFISRPWPDLIQRAKITDIEHISATSAPNEYQTQHVFKITVPIELHGMTPQLVLANPTGRAKLKAPPTSVAFRYGRNVWRFLQMTLFF